MPPLVKRFLVTAASDALILHSTNPKESKNAVKIDYRTNCIASTTSSKSRDEGEGLEIYGLVGILDLAESSYLICITKRKQVAKIWGKDVFGVEDVGLIPLHQGREEVEGVLGPLIKQQKSRIPNVEEEDEESEEEVVGAGDEGEPEDEAAALEPPKEGGMLKKSTTFVRDVVQDRGKYGRFATRWFSRNGSREGVKRQEGMASGDKAEGLTKEQTKQTQQALPENEKPTEATSGEEEGNGGQHETPAAAKQQQSAIEHLTPRILKSARLYFSSGGFYFSYEHDISGSLSQRSHGHGSVTPLWKRFDELFFWNRHLMKPFIESGQDSLVLPLMQGFVGQRSFSIARTEGAENDVVAEAVQDAEGVVKVQEEQGESKKHKEKESPAHNFLLTLVSRRSIRRAGLRYLRRGVDDDGAVANSVETEQILSSRDWSDSVKTFSLLQVRGSIPLFFSQTPYSFKPVPVIFGSEATNQTAFRKHFEAISKRYGQVQAASLIDQHGTEVSIGEAYERHAKRLNEDGGIDGREEVGFEWFDFHGACKGMRFENVQLLMDKLQGQLDSFGWIVKQNDRNIREQTGVLRTNCMDCLDRTNVVQSAVAGWALQQQLAELGINIDLKSDPKTQWFNTLWADNGDAISKQYAGTSALKGDFTRTRKRNWTGALSDFSLTLNRYYNNIFGDYFLQTNIDYFLGNAGPAIFDDFETDMMSQDYALDMRHVRQNAIDTCIKIVLEDPLEELKAGWILSCPSQSNTLRSLPFEECVLLLTDKAIYFCRFNWETEKIGSFERVALLDIKEMFRGVYVTSALGGTHLDEKKNVGFVVKYEIRGEGMVRTNTRSLGVAQGMEENNENTEKDQGKDKKSNQQRDETRILAFKALPPKAVAAKDEDEDLLKNTNEGGLVKHICDEIQSCWRRAWEQDMGYQHIVVDQPPSVEERDVISVSEAKRSTGYLESLGYGLKRLVWS
ncbi:related to SAC1-recessive suppressor of secretory defect [Lecanosticta acicola]|uniref:Related to SAC1-recessive suppressor of secretory defect n=1 Tax=Lecanosticta acicola TaxID=111012 RepID=A0AAI8Z2B5_9PEZI|nr:related to SAC1-recessive suppressor of secretory defect [Lecanosticta acicola]